MARDSIRPTDGPALGEPSAVACQSEPGIFVGSAWPGATTTLLCSRLGRQLERHPRVFEALRTAVAFCPPEQTILVADDQTLYPFLVRLADWYPFGLCEVTRCEAGDLPAVERKRRARFAESGGRFQQWICVVDAEQLSEPIDHWLARRAAEVRALHVRSGGLIAEILEQITNALDQPNRARVLLLSDPAWSHQPWFERCVARGAMPWVLLTEDDVDSALNQRPLPDPHPVDPRSGPPLRLLSELGIDRYVAHFVRAPRGAWVDESPQAYLDRLLFAEEQNPRDGFATLARVLRRQRLVANNRLTRAAARVLCFTERPLTEFSALRTFQSHLGRWDFEPLGLAIEKTYFRRLGGRPVVYGGDDDWSQLAPEDRPFFQLAFSRDGKHDWRVERECRLLGDLDLRSLDRNRVVVFVPDRAAAAALQDLCRFPLVAIDPRP